jgi:hypothetical protein
VETLGTAFGPINEYPRLDPANASAVTLQTDEARGLTVARPLTFGEIADALVAAGWVKAPDPAAEREAVADELDAHARAGEQW